MVPVSCLETVSCLRTLSGVFGDLPERVFGLAHWQNLFGDMPLVALIVAGDAYLLAKQAFGSYLLPWEKY